MKPSWSIFDCRQLISFQLPLTVAFFPEIYIDQVTSGCISWTCVIASAFVEATPRRSC
jgi:hypothetical protein